MTGGLAALFSPRFPAVVLLLWPRLPAAARSQRLFKRGNTYPTWLASCCAARSAAQGCDLIALCSVLLTGRLDSVAFTPLLSKLGLVSISHRTWTSLEFIAWVNGQSRPNPRLQPSSRRRPATQSCFSHGLRIESGDNASTCCCIARNQRRCHPAERLSFTEHASPGCNKPDEQ